MLFFALISELPFDLGFFRRYARFDGTFPFYWGYQNVYFTLFLGILALWCLDKFSYKGEDRKQKVKAFALQILSVIAACIAATLISSDYGGQGIVFIVGLYLARKSRLAQSLVFLVLYIATTGNQPPVYTMIAALIILLYNGKRGRKLPKYFFYWFYPGHIFVLYLISLILGVTL